MCIRDRHLSFVYRHSTKDITKNFEIEEGIRNVEELLSDSFLIGNLFTTQKDFVVEIGKNGKARMRSNDPLFITIQDKRHDKAKPKLIKEEGFLQELGILDRGGKVQKGKGDKLKQINKFVEIVDSLLRKNEELLQKDQLNVVDMGSGKGYLTFAPVSYTHLTLPTIA